MVRRKVSSNLCGFEGAEGAKAQAIVKVERRKTRGRPNAKASESEKAAAIASKLSLVSGDNSLRDPPVPIPNTEVKPQHAESTWLETAR